MSEIVPFTQQVISHKPIADEQGHERRLRAGSGVWACRLETVTPLCIKSAYDRLAPENAPAFVPATSIRGMLRNTAEILGAGCLPGGKACGEKAACVVCRMFGFVEDRSDFAWRSKIRFSDTAKVKVNWASYQTPRERPAEGRGDGWILFPHTTPRLVPGRGSPYFVPAKTAFTFRLEYLNLDEEEYAVLLLALTLNDGTASLCHKLGYAKSLGFGACRITLIKDPAPAAAEPWRRYTEDVGFQALRKWRYEP